MAFSNNFANEEELFSHRGSQTECQKENGCTQWERNKYIDLHMSDKSCNDDDPLRVADCYIKFLYDSGKKTLVCADKRIRFLLSAF